MPKIPEGTITNFDAEGVIEAVHQQDIGLRITTNNPDSFKQLIYRAAAKLRLKVHIYSYPKRPNSLALLKEPATATESPSAPSA